MKAVDTSDQLVAYYPSAPHRTVRNWLNIHWYLIDTAIVNAFIVLRHMNVQQGVAQSVEGQLVFRRTLSNALVGGRTYRAQATRAPTPAAGRDADRLSDRLGGGAGDARDGPAGRVQLTTALARAKIHVPVRLSAAQSCSGGGACPGGRAGRHRGRVFCLGCTAVMCLTYYRKTHTQAQIDAGQCVEHAMAGDNMICDDEADSSDSMSDDDAMVQGAAHASSDDDEETEEDDSPWGE